MLSREWNTSSESGITPSKERRYSKKQLVSVIIPTKNNARTIGMCLHSIRKQTYPNLETIIVDSNSIDGTTQIARNHGAKILSIVGERTRAKNLGASSAEGLFLFFVDSDVELTTKVIEDCVEICSKGFDAVIVGEEIVGDGFWTRCRSIERGAYIGDDLIESPTFFRKQVFLDSGGYDESLVFGEEADLHRRVYKLGFRIVRIPTLVLHHEGEFSTVVQRKYYYGKTSLAYIRRYGLFTITQFGPSRFLRKRNARILAKNHLWVLGILVSKSIEYIASALGLIVELLSKSKKEDEFRWPNES